jgi:tRNA threonylcarbamoyladenosine biosynthesis protein TsaE
MILASEEATEALGIEVARRLVPGDVVALSGDLGAGKTVLARGIARGLGFEGDVASPTFPIVLVYDEPEMRLPLWHVDLYRIEHQAELPQLGLEEALDTAVLVVEWPQRLGPKLWAHSLQLELRRRGDGERALTANVPPAWEGRWPPR